MSFDGTLYADMGSRESAGAAAWKDTHNRRGGMMSKPSKPSKPARSSDIVCRGSYAIGSACGRCSRCEEALLDLIAELSDDEACSYDHHGYCQTHNLQEKPCPHERAQQILAAMEAKGKR